MAVRKFLITKDNTSFFNDNTNTRRGAGKEAHWLIGKWGNRRYWTQAQATFNWDGMVRVTRAELVLTGDDNHIGMGSGATFVLRQIRGTSEWQEGDAVGKPPGAEDENWEEGDYEDPTTIESSDWRKLPGTITPGVGETRLDVLTLLKRWGKTSVKFRINNQDIFGNGQENNGFQLTNNAPDIEGGCEFCSSDHNTAGSRPYIEVEYDPPNQPPTAAALAPRGEVFEDDTFRVGFSDIKASDTFAKYQIETRRQGETRLTWDTTRKTGTQEREDAIGVVPIPLNTFTVGPQFEWRARVWDQLERASAWTAWTEWKLKGNAPTINTRPLGTLSTLDGEKFEAGWTHPDDRPIVSLRIQVRLDTPAGSPLWDGADNAWDTGDVTPTSGERTARLISRDYLGDSLPAGSYSWRIRIRDRIGVDSPWGYGVFTLTQNYDPNPENYEYTSGYGRRLHAYRIVLYGMGPNRGPSGVKAIIEDAANLGTSQYVNAPGELYFTLPATHWQVSECEPYQRHYSVQQYVGGAWKERFAGILTDFDATGDDAVIYGMDYLGLLSLDVERRSASKENGNKLVEDGGAKYATKRGTSPSRKWRISEIIEEQLETARDLPDSTTGFISPVSIDTLGNEVAINASFRQRLDFINGLIDSAKAGTGNKTRLVPRRERLPDGNPGAWQWHLIQKAGKQRPELRMEFGGLVQGFRVVAMGDFAVRVLGIGRKVEELQPFFRSAGGGALQNLYGNLAKVAVWQDIDDDNDLQRRVQQLLAESSRVGKRIALGLRVHALSPFDGWDLCDEFPLRLDRGVVHTDRYGSGWWVIWGMEWRLFPDGHDELTLVVRPREDEVPPDPDLIPAKEFIPVPEWTLGVGPPVSEATRTGEEPTYSLYYLDEATRDVYERQEDGTYVLTANPSVPITDFDAHLIDTTPHPSAFGPVSASTTFGQSSANGLSTTNARSDHLHGTPADPIPAHVAAGDPHPGYATDADLASHAGAADPHAGYQQESEKGTANGYASLDASTLVPRAQLGTGTPDTTTFLRGDASWVAPPGGGSGGGTPGSGTTTSAVGEAVDQGASTDYSRTDHRHGREAFGAVAAQTTFGAGSTNGLAATIARSDHTHGTPTDPVTAHIAAGDPHTGYATDSDLSTHAATSHGVTAHSALSGLTTGDDHTQYQKESEKGAASGYAALDSGILVPVAQLGSGTPDGTKFLRDDRTWVTPPGGGGGAPTTATYLVTTADATLSAEVVVGTTPGGELGGTWASPTVDASHSGSTHAATQSAAESTAASALTTHAGAADPHTGYRLESADHTHASTGLQAGQVAHTALSGVTADQHHAQAHALSGSDHTGTLSGTQIPFGTPVSPASDVTPANGSATTVARSDHQHGNLFVAQDALSDGGQIRLDGAGANVDVDVDNFAGRFRVFSGASVYLDVDAAKVAATVQAFGDAAAAGSSNDVAYADHRHGMPADPITVNSWTPTLTSPAPGTLSVVYATRVAYWFRVGNMVTVWWTIVTSTWTYGGTPPTGNLAVTGHGFTAAASPAGMLWTGSASLRYTKTGYTNLASVVAAGSGSILFRGSGTGQAVATLAVTDCPTAVQVTCEGSLSFMV